MRIGLLVLSIALVGCAGTGGAWPSLARRPIEGPAIGATPPASSGGKSSPGASTPSAPAAAPVAASAASLPAQPAGIASVPAGLANVPAGLGDVPARLATLDRDLTDLATRFDEQRAATARAVTAARGAKADSEPWAAAELERSRLERIGSQIDDMRGRLDTIAGSIAAAATKGADVAVPLRATGGLIARADTLAASFKSASSGEAATDTP